MKNKYLKLILFLSLILIPYIVLAETTSFEDNIGMCIFIEIFVSIHMSVFVLFPLATIINKAKKEKIFIYLFITRAIVLLIGNTIYGLQMAMYDFISVFLGAFIVVPIAAALKLSLTSSNTRYNEILEVDEIALLNAGIKNSGMIKNKLLDVYKVTQKAISENDEKTLKEYCTDRMFIKVSNILKMCKEYNYKNIIEDIDIKDSKITFVNHNAVETKISITAIISLKDYIIDSSGKLINKSSDKTQRLLCELTFIQENHLTQTKTKTKCQNCGAPIDKNIEKCQYCGTPNDIKIKRNEWLLSGKKILSNK